MAYVPSRVTNNGRGKRLAGFEYSHQHSAVAGEVPATSSLAPGEIAANVADGVLYCKNPQDTLVQFPSGVGINRIETITQAAHDALNPAVATTLYIVTPNP